MNNHICPWWLAYTFDNPLRKLFHRPEKILGAYVKEGMTVLDVGCGMGYFSIGMARMVGPRGRVISVDIQDKMLAVLKRRAEREGVSEVIDTRLSGPNGIGIDEKVDFALAFWMVHEVPEKKRLFSELSSSLNSGSRLLITEPVFHVSIRDFMAELDVAKSEGLCVEENPRITFSCTALLRSC
jgi:ubiquinone/menaquinone biosynthesis C-methylase UbiE